MNTTHTVTTYADSPERMLLLSILFLFAVALLILSNQRWAAKPARVGLGSGRVPAELGRASPRAARAT